MTSGQDFFADGQVVEAETFARLACDPAHSVLVEACAGSGKTWLLVSRLCASTAMGNTASPKPAR